jgi:hypothetical protein
VLSPTPQPYIITDPNTPLVSNYGPPQQQPVYVVTNVGQQVPLMNQPGYPNQPDVNFTQVSFPQGNYHNSEELYKQLTMRNYHANPCNWISQGWTFFKMHPGFHICWTLILMGLSIVPQLFTNINFYVFITLFVISFFFSQFYIYGILMILKNIVRTNGNLPAPNALDGFKGYLVFFPTLLLEIIMVLLIALGFFLFIIPGLYFAIAACFSVLIFLEYHQLGLSQWQSIKVSVSLVNKDFCSILGFLLLSNVVAFLGILCLGVGILVSLPVVMLSMVCAFRDVVGFSDSQTSFV